MILEGIDFCMISKIDIIFRIQLDYASSSIKEKIFKSVLLILPRKSEQIFDFGD